MFSQKLSLLTLLSVLPLAGTAGQVAVVNPGSASGVAVAATTVTTPTATPTPTTTTPTPTTTKSTPTTTTPTTTVNTPTTAPTLTRIISALTNSTSTVTQEAGVSAASGSSESSSGGSDAASSTPSSVSGYAPQLMATIQRVNVTTFTPQQASTLINIIEAQISQPGTPASVRQALTIEKARLAAIASN